jgi:hypothetical protein
MAYHAGFGNLPASDENPCQQYIVGNLFSEKSPKSKNGYLPGIALALPIRAVLTADENFSEMLTFQIEGASQTIRHF